MAEKPKRIKRDTWRCDYCGNLYLLDLEKPTHCLTHGESEHCHLGDRRVCPDGAIETVPASPQCIPWVPQ